MQVEETTPSTPLRPTRAGFVRGLPLTMPVEEVIERGREVGLELQPSDIHAARYYMRQMAAAESSSIPQQLMLGGTFVTKREPRAANGASGANGAAAKAHGSQTNGSQTNGSHTNVEKLAPSESAPAVQRLRDPDYDDDFAEPAVVEPKKPGRTKVLSPAAGKAAAKAAKVAAKAAAKAAASAEKAEKAELKANGANGLHNRLQARLRNATFRDRDARDARDAREDREARDDREVSAREVKATVGKALLLDLDNALKPRSKRAVQTAEAMEEQLRLIALRIGTQRVREILDEMEELAARA